MRKRVLIFSHGLELGGAERALLGLLEAFDYSKYHVELFLMHHTGELMEYIPSEVKLLPEISQYASLAVPIMQVLLKGQIRVFCGRFVGKIMATRYVKSKHLSSENNVYVAYSHKYTCWAMPSLETAEYDIAISFLAPHYFVAHKVRAKKKVAWIHTDYSQVQTDIQSELLMWEKYDNIVSISNDVSSSFLKIYPIFTERIIVIENILPARSILAQITKANVQIEMPDNKYIKILSIGRFCKAKNFENIPEICKMIINNGINIKWYLIGFGGNYKLIKDKIFENNVQDFVIILGKKDNPYPYINACDLYVQPSRYEGNCVSVREAQMMGKPVVITNYPTSSCQIRNGYDGIIVPLDNEGCAKGLTQILKNPKTMERLSHNCKKDDYIKQEEIEKLYALLENEVV